jgi:hypothetical protein
MIRAREDSGRLKVVRTDADENSMSAAKHGVRAGIPFNFVPEWEGKGRKSGVLSSSQLLTWLDSLYVIPIGGLVCFTLILLSLWL